MKEEPKKDSKRDGKLKSKEYDKELAKLHVKLVNLQEWVKAKGRTRIEVPAAFPATLLSSGKPDRAAMEGPPRQRNTQPPAPNDAGPHAGGAPLFLGPVQLGPGTSRGRAGSR